MMDEVTCKKYLFNQGLEKKILEFVYGLVIKIKDRV